MEPSPIYFVFFSSFSLRKMTRIIFLLHGYDINDQRSACQTQSVSDTTLSKL